MKKLLIAITMILGFTGFAAAQKSPVKTTAKFPANNKSNMTYQKIEWEKTNRKVTINNAAGVNKNARHVSTIQSSETDGAKNKVKTKQKN